MIIKKYIQLLQKEFKGYNLNKFRMDLVAGITVAAVALPLALAFGVGSGADATAGLITAIVAAIVIGSLSGTSYQISGPTGAMMAILIPLVAKHGLETLFVATFLAGIILFFSGILKVGKFVNFIPTPVIVGFTSGISIVIALGQLGNLLGVPFEGESVVQKVIFLFSQISYISITSLIIGLLVIAFIIFWPKNFNKYVPASLLAIILATILSAFFNLNVTEVGNIPQTIIHEKRLSPSELFNVKWEIALLPALSIAVLSIIESLLSGVAGARMKNEKMDADQELISQGIGNMIIPFFGGVPATAAIARTSVVIKAGAQSRLAGIIHGLILVLSIYLLSGFMSKIPLSALSGVLIMTAWKMNEWDSINYIFSRRFKGAISKFLVTLIFTVVFDLTIAIAVGLFLAIVLLLIKLTNIDIQESYIDPNRLDFEVDSTKSASVIYITGILFFGVANLVENRLKNIDNDIVIFSMRGVPEIDSTTINLFLDFTKEAKLNNKIVVFSCLQPNVFAMFEKSGMSEYLDKNCYYDNAKDAINTLLKKG